MLLQFKKYIQITRPSHWFKNVFMLPGIFLAFYFHPDLELNWYSIILGLVSTSLIASSYYIYNQIFDAKYDAFHPTKKNRPIPSGQISKSITYIIMSFLAFSGLLIAWTINVPFFYSILLLLFMAFLYNTPPIRLKDIQYADVLSESLNNPLRMTLGWFLTGTFSLPTLSILLAYWMFGAFLMGIKRLAEFREIGNLAVASSYRKSFGKYTEASLLVSIMFYAICFAFALGIFVTRYRMELLLAMPIIAISMGYYLYIGFKENSLVQTPEEIYRHPKLFILLSATGIICVMLLFFDIPVLHALFPNWYILKL